MNKVYFRFDKNLSVANLVPTIIDYKTPKTEFVLQNYKDLSWKFLLCYYQGIEPIFPLYIF